MSEETLDNDLSFVEARLGIQAESFLHSDIGKYLTGRAELEIEEGRDELEAATGDKEITVAKDKIRGARRFIVWLGNAIQNGRIAEDQIRAEKEA